MIGPRVPLFERLPEIYRIKDASSLLPDQLRDYLALVEDAFGAIHENIEALYHDLFIEFCDEWAIPYIGDLLGTSHSEGRDAGRCARMWPIRSRCAGAKARSARSSCWHSISPAGVFTAWSCWRTWSGTSTSITSGRMREARHRIAIRSPAISISR